MVFLKTYLNLTLSVTTGFLRGKNGKSTGHSKILAHNGSGYHPDWIPIETAKGEMATIY